jgi:hypothetical protein
LHKKLQRLEQGDMSVQEYFAELQKGMIRCGIVEDMEDKIVHFYGGLRHEIQDIVDYKECNTTNQLFQFAMLAEKELQGRHQPKSRSNYGSAYTPKAITLPPTKLTGASPAAPPGEHSFHTTSEHTFSTTSDFTFGE